MVDVVKVGAQLMLAIASDSFLLACSFPLASSACASCISLNIAGKELALLCGDDMISWLAVFSLTTPPY